MDSSTSSSSEVHSESVSSWSPIKEEQFQLGGLDVSSKNVETDEKLKNESSKNPSEEMDNTEKEKYQKYAADYTRYLKAKYFSDKTIFGGNIYDVKTTSDGQTVKAGRLPPYKLFADPATFLAMVRADPKPKEKTKGEPSDGKQTTKKSS